jgi:hypothetical protein
MMNHKALVRRAGTRPKAAFCFSFMFLLVPVLTGVSALSGQETLPPLRGEVAPSNLAEMYAGFDPRKEPLETEIMKEWEQDGVVLRVVRFRIGIFKGQKSILAAIYGFPKSAAGGAEKLPGLVQIHGGGQYAHYNACLQNAKRGYATVSISWAGRISAPGFEVNPKVVELFWAGKVDDPNYKLTTDWGALDGYHAPSRHPGNSFPQAKPAEWTLDAIESPRNSPWFICTLAARRALTFLQHQSEVDPGKLGVYGHSMGGKLTVMTAIDPRVKAAAPSCGGISDRDNESELFRLTIGDDVSLKQISCPIVFLSPANDFHGRIVDLPDAVSEIQSKHWRVTCSPHHNHRDTPEYEVATLLWFDQHLKGSFTWPQTPQFSLHLETHDRVPEFTFEPDRSMPVCSVGVFYTQQGKADETRFDRELTINRFWHYAQAAAQDGRWTARLPLTSTDKPLWVYGNVAYDLPQPVTGAGYYYGTYTAGSFNVSSVLHKVTPDKLKLAGSKANLKPVFLGRKISDSPLVWQKTVIDRFERDWQKEWFTYDPDRWACATHKIFHPVWRAPENARLVFDVRAEQPNELVVLIDGHASEVAVTGGNEWQKIRLWPGDFKNFAGEELGSWENIKELKLSHAEHLRPGRGQQGKPKLVGKNWRGPDPEFRNLLWEVVDGVSSIGPSSKYAR